MDNQVPRLEALSIVRLLVVLLKDHPEAAGLKEAAKGAAPEVVQVPAHGAAEEAALGLRQATLEALQGEAVLEAAQEEAPRGVVREVILGRLREAAREVPLEVPEEARAAVRQTHQHLLHMQSRLSVPHYPLSVRVSLQLAERPYQPVDLPSLRMAISTHLGRLEI